MWKCQMGQDRDLPTPKELKNILTTSVDPYLDHKYYLFEKQYEWFREVLGDDWVKEHCIIVGKLPDV